MSGYPTRPPLHSRTAVQEHQRALYPIQPAEVPVIESAALLTRTTSFAGASLRRQEAVAGGTRSKTRSSMALTKSLLIRLSLAWHSPLNSLALYGHVLLVLLCAAFLAVMAGVGALDDEIRCVDQRTQEPVREQWLLALCTQYSGTEFQGRRRDALSYSLFHYLVMFMLALNLVPSAVRSHLDHRQMQKFLRTFGDNERQAAASTRDAAAQGRVSFVSLLVMAVNVVVLLTSSHMTLLDPSSYPFEQYLGETMSQFGHVFPGTAQCRVQPSMMLGAYTDTYGCHFPLSQHYRHILLAMLIVVGVGLVLSLLTFLIDAAMVFAGPSASLVYTACRDPGLERRVARQWTRDELEALRLVRQKTDMDAFVWILSQLDFEEDPVEVVVAGEASSASTEGDLERSVRLELDLSLGESSSDSR
ncbi:hypothetical protein C7M84_023726 [Penaeus vannamei]|uniref:Uncharacterized protein n=1 Tax=Penaeus vannamei TaxID=6689 RepID=A0A3R7PUN9_PENVA|nr:hypothetical protein C7M84_023726 [Penaeus vannamei]